MPSFEFESKLSAPADEVWTSVSRMEGVNYELSPLARMTAPSAYRARAISDWERGRPLFTSIILLGGILPWDLHFFRLEEATAGSGFRENSSSLFQREWRHTRSIAPAGDSSCVVKDRVEYVPRLLVPGRLLLPVFRMIFRHRHKRLIKKFGSTG